MRTFVSTLLVVLACVLVTSANASSFTTTYNLASLNVADFSTPPDFFTGPFNYGYTPLGLDGSVNGPVNITSISVSADATVNFPLVLQNGNLIAFNWEVYVGPSPFGYAPGQVNDSLTRPDTLTGTAPTLLQFSQADIYQTTAQPQFTGTYDFLSNTLTSNATYNLFFAGTVPYNANGLYTQIFMWSEADDSIDFSNITVTVSGTTVPEPSSVMLMGSGVLGLAGVIRRKLSA